MTINKSLTFAHSGTSGDTLIALAFIRALGGGHLYLKLNNIDRVVQKYLGWPNGGVHSGRMTQDDFNSLEQLISHQPYITGFSIWNGEPIDYDFDLAATKHHITDWPRNVPNIYARALDLEPEQYRKQVQIDSWIECREPIKVPDRPIAVFRGTRYLDGNPLQPQEWLEWLEWGLAEQSFFIGLPNEYDYFCKTFGVTTIPYIPTKNFWEMSQYLQGAEMMITSMGGPCALGICMGKTMQIEYRKNVSIEQLEINWPWRSNLFYF
jgi:hypothetical protein